VCLYSAGSGQGWHSEKHCPRENGKEQHRNIKPEWLNVLEFRGEVAFEIVLDDEDAEEIGIAARAEDVPGKGGNAERDDASGVKQAEGIAPALGEERPEKYRAAAQNDGRWSLGKDGEAEKKAEQHGSKER